MVRAKKTDNHDPAAKLELRRYFLRKYHGPDDPPNVLDCCQGSALLWRRLRKEFPLAGYWGIDLKRKAGRLTIDSSRVLAQPGWPQNVVDIDTYGVPWKHWLALLPNVARPTTVFLTVGRIIVAGSSPASRQEIEAAGAMFRRLKLSPAFGPTIARLAVDSLLTRSCGYGKIITEAVEAVSSGNARYIGVRLEKANGHGSESPAAVLDKNRAERSNGHV